MKNRDTFYYQTGIFHEDDDDVIKAILKVYNNVFILDNSFQIKYTVEEFANDKKVRGSINLIDYLSNSGNYLEYRHRRDNSILLPKGCIPKISEISDYDKFGTEYREFLINKDFVIADMNYLAIQLDSGNYKESFIRSVSSKKLLVGGLYSRNYLNIQLSSYKKDHNFPVVLASPKKISKEYRFFLKYKKIVSGCQYMKNGELHVNSEVPENVKQFASDFAQKLNGSVMDVVDIGEENGNLGIVEINDYRTSSFYGCDFEKILRNY